MSLKSFNLNDWLIINLFTVFYTLMSNLLLFHWQEFKAESDIYG